MNDNFQLLASWTGLIGGASGFVALILQFGSFYREAPRIETNLFYAIEPNTGKRFISIDVINKGSKAISIGNVGIGYTNGHHSPFGLFPQSERKGSNFPYRLEGHSSESWLVSAESLRLAISDNDLESKIRSHVSLRTGKSKWSKYLGLQDE